MTKCTSADQIDDCEIATTRQSRKIDNRWCVKTPNGSRFFVANPSQAIRAINHSLGSVTSFHEFATAEDASESTIWVKAFDVVPARLNSLRDRRWINALIAIEKLPSDWCDQSIEKPNNMAIINARWVYRQLGVVR